MKCYSDCRPPPSLQAPRLSCNKNRPASSEVGRLLVVSGSRLERKLASQLPESGFVRSGCPAEVAIREIGIDVCVVCPVEQVEDLKPELESHSFGNVRVLVEVDAGLVKIGTTEPVRL